jgi:F-type H+-transporting ATPase subunit gamma
MANTRALVKRRQALNNIKKITKTMELIATSRFQKAMKRAQEAAAFTRKIAELASDLARSAGGTVKHPLLEKREPVKNTLLLVLAANRGLCGGYNASILREASADLREIQASGSTPHLELSGKRAIAYFRFQTVPIEATYTHFEDKPRFEEVAVLANKYLAAYEKGQIDQLRVAYVKFFSAGRQKHVVETLLPLSALAPEQPAQPAATPKVTVEYEFLPSARGILEEILPMSFKIRLFKCFLDAAVSEQIARRVAMKAATDKTSDMIKTISSLYNRARQANITREISEILGGSEALRG